MRFALPLLLIGAVVACADPTTAPQSLGATISAYRVIGGPGTGNPPPPPLSVNVVLIVDSTHSTTTSGAFDVNASRDGGTVQVGATTGGGSAGFAAAVASPPGLVTFTPGAGGGTVTGNGLFTFVFPDGTVLVDLSQNLRSGNSQFSPTCVIPAFNACALLRIEGALFTPYHGTARRVNGYVQVTLPPS